MAAGYGALGEAMRAAGVFIDSGQLSPSNASKLVRVTGGQAEVIDCSDLTAALDWAARIPAATCGSIEARPPR